jgi:hypothetical protein
VGADGRLNFRAGALMPLHGQNNLRKFSKGALAFGILRPGASQFDVLRATIYDAKASA